MGTAWSTPGTALTSSTTEAGSADVDMCIVRTPACETQMSAPARSMYTVSRLVAPAKTAPKKSTSVSASPTPPTERTRRVLFCVRFATARRNIFLPPEDFGGCQVRDGPRGDEPARERHGKPGGERQHDGRRLDRHQELGLRGQDQPAHEEGEADTKQGAQAGGNQRLPHHQPVEHAIAGADRLDDAVLVASLNRRRVDHHAHDERADDER